MLPILSSAHALLCCTARVWFNVTAYVTLEAILYCRPELVVCLLVGMTSRKAFPSKRTPPQILPCTVSQLLAAPEVSGGIFAIGNLILHQVSILGIIREFDPYVMNEYTVDDMTGPPLIVKQWLDAEDCALMTSFSPGMYIKAIGSLHSFMGRRTLLANNIRPIKDLNEITSHMMEVVKAHLHHFKKGFDVNMNISAAPYSGSGRPKYPGGLLPNGLSTVHGQSFLGGFGT